MSDLPNSIKMLFQKAGSDITVTRIDGTTQNGKALIQPLLYKNKIYIEMQPSEVGRLDDGCHLYLGPYDVLFSSDDFISVDDSMYVVQRFEKVKLFGKHLYSWAVIRPVVAKEVQ